MSDPCCTEENCTFEVNGGTVLRDSSEESGPDGYMIAFYCGIVYVILLLIGIGFFRYKRAILQKQIDALKERQKTIKAQKPKDPMVGDLITLDEQDCSEESTFPDSTLSAASAYTVDESRTADLSEETCPLNDDESIDKHDYLNVQNEVYLRLSNNSKTSWKPSNFTVYNRPTNNRPYKEKNSSALIPIFVPSPSRRSN